MQNKINLEEIKSILEEVIEIEFIDFNDNQLIVQFMLLNPLEIRKVKSAIVQKLTMLGHDVSYSGISRSKDSSMSTRDLWNQLSFTLNK